MTENVTSDALDHNDFSIPCHVTYKMKGSTFQCVRPIGGHLTSPWPKMWHHMTSMTTTMTFVYPMSCDISKERLWLQYSTFQCFRPIRSFDLTMTENVTSDDLHEHSNDSVSHQMESNDFSIRPFNVLDLLEVIWPYYDRECDLRWTLWPQRWLFRIQCQVTYQMKGNDFIVYEKFEVILTNPWPKIGLKYWKVEYWSHHLSFDTVTWHWRHGISKRHFCGHGGHRRSHFRSNDLHLV